ncbi:hypothetical protein DYBT9275_02335 [Dyadobacter sp. CECT 9275]|uniref:TonB-dependent receptor plug domain-containing protein n=1 Tax=Dyadobacter helix TaxID=2822344 RepID=A0A916JBY0_9BACT|nr:SusC/RagA family TonB-linked outer membrane protein [Dyadobacter sp. CECT 9275]CAG4999884.1 hypothetical protein DYBT9275_02335 [Dyadobacter sp. CECT 9275]
MKKNLCFKAIFRTTMKITALQICVAIIFSGLALANDKLAAQNILERKVSVKMDDRPLKKVLSAIGHSTGVNFMYNPLEIKSSALVSVNASNEQLENVLSKLLTPLHVTYEVSGRQILLFKMPEKEGNENRNTETDPQGPIDRKVSGNVKDRASGEALPGVSILLKGSTQGTVTDASGNYSLTLPDGDGALIFSYVGYKVQEIMLGNKSVVDVTMEADVKALGEVVVTALGISREKSSLGYAVGEIKGSAIQKVPQENVLNALTGKVVGLKISNSNSDLNGETQVIIRGKKSLAGADSPLIVIDGVPVGDDARVIADLNANNVESVSVLKGPSAAALYGSRAGNGVLIITTKNGDTGRKGIGVTFNSGYTASIPYHYIKTQNRFTSGRNGEFNESAFTHWYGPEEGTNAVQWNSNGQSVPLKFYPNNQKNYFRTGNSFINDIGVSGSSGKGSFQMSLSDMRGTGTYPGTELKKNAFDFAASYNVTPRFKLSANVHIVNSGSDNYALQSLDDYQYEDIFFVPPHVNVNDLKDYWVDPNVLQRRVTASTDNPWYTAYESTDQFKMVRVYGNAKFDWKLSEAFSLMGRLGNSKTNNEVQQREAYSDKWYPKGYYLSTVNYREETNTDFLLSYKKDIRDISVNASVGANIFYLRGSASSIGGQNLLLPGLYTSSNIDRANVSYSNSFSEKMVYSAYGIASVGYKNFVYLDLTGRNDWSSTLPANNRSYFYPSASLSLVVNNMFDLPKSVSMLKLRGGWAEVGKDTDPYRLGQTLVKGNWANYETYARNTVMPNVNLKPENAVSSEFGFDLAMFRKKAGLNVTYYKVANRNQILNVPIADISGYTSAQVNAGVVENKGLEIELWAKPVQTKDFSWDFNINFTKDRSKLKKLTDGINTYSFWSQTGIYAQTKVGENIGDLYGYDILRVTDGEYKGWPLLDANGRSQRGTQMQKIANVISDFFVGFQTSVTYKNFTLSANLDWRQGGQYYSMTMLRLARGGLIEDWHNGISSSTFSGILGNNSFNGNNDQLAAEIKNNPEIYRDNKVWVGGRNAELGGFPLAGRNNGAFYPGVRSNGQGGYVENFGAEGTKLFASDLIVDPGGGYWSQGVDNWIYDASYVKMRELALSYQFPKNFTDKIKAQNLSLSLFTKNLILWTKAKNDIDPELAFVYTGGRGGTYAQGFDRWNAGPWTASLGLKLNVQF